ncbi:MAG: LTA synthase family protein [Clostridia bacterium]|nr:LTA synthase family protein [Clostridia bacterium]
MSTVETSQIKQKKQPKNPLFSCTVFRYFTISTSVPRLIAGGMLTLLLVTLVLMHTASFMDPTLLSGRLLYGLSLAACAILGVLTMLRWGVNTQSVAAGISCGVAALLPIVAMTMAECLNGVFTWDWTPQTLMLNYILYLVLYGLVFVFCGRFRLPLLVVNSAVFALALTNFYVMLYRGTPFVPMDFFAASTAANVMAAYDFAFNYQVVIAIILLVFLTVAAWKLRTPDFKSLGKLAGRVFCGTLSVCVICIYCFTDLYAESGLKPDFWNQARGYSKTGVVMNFCLNTKYIFPQKPSGYQAGTIEGIITDPVEGTVTEELGITGTPVTPAKTPNIICIMNESLADLSVLGDVQTNIEYMPYLNSLTENTIRGNLYVPVIGSGTSNTEFEFLTGLSTGFFPAGSNAYSLYIKDPLPSLTSILEGQSFSSLAFHPYYASGWNRIAVYNHFGFDRFLSLSSVIPNSILTQYSASGFSTSVLQDLVEEIHPGEGVLIRRYVSDSYDYKAVIQQYEKRDKSKPFYLFNVTMQNHGGYTEHASNFDEQVFLTGMPAGAELAEGKNVYTAFPKTNQYLSLMKYSDEAFAQLIAYFEQQEEPTIICMFGDHQPSIEKAYVRALLGASDLNNLSIQQEMQRHVTPFYIWANYDIPEETVDALSVNYLSSYVLKTAGVELPAFNRYLLKLSETLPVISSVGYMDAEGNMYKNGSSSPYSALLKEYEHVTYNYMFDKQNRDESLYTILP